MNIQKSYEALAADLASEKILSKTLLGQKEAYMMLADKGRLDLATLKQKACEAAEREAALREELDCPFRIARHSKRLIEELRKRLTVADQRVDDLEGLLRDADSAHGNMLMSDPPQEAWKYHRISERIAAALKPAAEGEGS